MANKNTAPTFVVSTGTVKTSIGAGSEGARFVAFQPDGKIVVAGHSVTGDDFDLALVRYSRNGSLDPTFSGDGVLSADFDSMQDVVTGFAIQPDGKFLVAISTGFLVRYNSDGNIDSSFGYGGKLTTTVGGINLQGICLAVQPDGKILVGGVYWRGGLNGDFGLFRFNSDGNVDINFGERGVVTTDINKTYDTPHNIAVQPDGKIVLAGYAYNGQHDIALVRYLKDGSLDVTFSDDGKVLTDLGTRNDKAYGLAFQSDGKIIVSGSSGENDRFTLVRYNDNGSLDIGFSGDGVVKESINFSASVIVQSDGKILATGGTGLMRYFPDGSRDIDFDATVVVPSGNYYQALAMQSDAGFIAAGFGSGIDGSTAIAVTSFKNSGEPDKLFGLPVDTLSGSVGYSENSGAVTLSSSVQIDDQELAAFGSFNGSNLTLSRQGRSNVQDVFSNTGTLSALNQGSFFSVDGVTIGRVTANNSGTLVLSFNNNATQRLVNKAMQNIAYKNTSDTPPSSVFIDWTFNDGNSGGQGTGGALSVTGTTTVNITATNDAPYLAIPVPDQRLEVDQFFTYQLQDKTFIDPDLETLINSISMADGTGLPPWLTFNRATNTISGTPSTEDLGNFVIQIKATDSAGASAYDYMNLIVDQKTVPSIAVSSNTSDLTAGSSVIITFTLSKPSTTFTASDVTVKGGTLSNFIGIGTNYTALFTPTANSTASGTVSVASGVFTDAAGNVNADGSDANNTITLAVDTVVPTIALSSTKSSLIAGEATVLTFTLSEASTTFTASDINVTGGTLSSFIGSGTTYSALFTPTANSTANGSVSVASGVFADAAGNTNADGSDSNNTIILAVDTIVPTIALSAAKSSLIAGDSTTLTFTLSEASTTFTASDVAVAGGTLSNFTGSGTSYTALFTPTSNSTTNSVISIANGVFTDTAGNTNADGSDANNNITLVIDTVIPTIAVSSNKSSLQGGDTATLTFTLSEASTNFVASDITVAGGTLSNFTGSGTSYSATFTLFSNSAVTGSVNISNGVFTDAAGNKNTDGSDTNNTVSFTRIPTITNEIHTLSVIVDKNVLGADAVLLKDLKESMTFTNGAMTKHIVEYSGLTFDYSQIDSLITTVTRDGEFTADFTKEINEYLKTELNITYSAAVALVGAASIDGVILSVAGADGNFVS